MSMKNSYNTIWDYLVNLFQNNLTQVKGVYKSFVIRPPDYPLVSVLSWRDRFEWIDVKRHRPSFGFEILAVTHNTNPSQALRDASDLGWDIYDILMNDLELGGNLLEPLEFVEREQFQNLNDNTAGVILRIRCIPK